jgi:hypothetical protein
MAGDHNVLIAHPEAGEPLTGSGGPQCGRTISHREWQNQGDEARFELTPASGSSPRSKADLARRTEWSIEVTESERVERESFTDKIKSQ